MKKFFITVFIIIFIVVISCIGAFFYFKNSYLKHTYPLKSFVTQDTKITLKKRETLKHFSKKLMDKKIIDNRLTFYLWVKFFSNYSKYQSGRYLIKANDKIADIDKMIKDGKTHNPIVYKITIPEGWSFKQICQKIEKTKLDTFDNCMMLFKDESLMRQFNIKADSLEGYIYPLTYTFTKKPTLRKFIELAIQTFFKNLPKDYEEKISEKNLTLNQAITFASLIELESADTDERSTISGVIWNRLKANMTLGIDASVIYGIENYNGNITSEDLKNLDNKYNTRVHVGLPPSPIGSPSKESLLAVINPVNHDFYYYVLDGENLKKHVFSKNLKEHNALVRKYIKAYNNSK